VSRTRVGAPSSHAAFGIFLANAAALHALARLNLQRMACARRQRSMGPPLLLLLLLLGGASRAHGASQPCIPSTHTQSGIPSTLAPQDGPLCVTSAHTRHKVSTQRAITCSCCCCCCCCRRCTCRPLLGVCCSRRSGGWPPRRGVCGVARRELPGPASVTSSGKRRSRATGLGGPARSWQRHRTRRAGACVSCSQPLCLRQSSLRRHVAVAPTRTLFNLSILE
jgi:hypothetical protein